MIYHITAFILGSLLDLIIGDPEWMPHPVRLIGRWIGWLDRKMFVPGKKKQERIRTGRKFCVFVLLPVILATILLLVIGYKIHPVCGVLVEAILTCYCLAARSLREESMKVYRALTAGDLPAARRAVSRIVGRDTDSLDRIGVTKAAVETVAENTSDGVIAPMFYTCLGGPVLGLLYKAVNTMDSMVGYRNKRYRYYGRAAARLDDILNLLPSRISAWLMIAAAAILGQEYDAERAKMIFLRDRFNHKSPNAAQTESVCAGALGIRLAGDASYFGKVVQKPYIGDDTRPVEAEDIRRANWLMYTTTGLMFLLASAVWLIPLALMGWPIPA
jgi:adenosylcobinamide-phosphate synthase